MTSATAPWSGPAWRWSRERAARQPEPAAGPRHRLHRRGGADRAQGLDDHPGRRQGRHRDPAFLLPRQAGGGGQLPHVPGRYRSGRALGAQAVAGLRHPGHGRVEGVHPQREGAAVPAQRDGVPAGQPPARLPGLRPGRRVRTAGRGHGLRPLGQPLRRAQACGRRRGHRPAGGHRDDPLHPLHPLRALHRRDRRHLRARRDVPRRESADRHLRRQAADHRAVGQCGGCVPGGRADQQGVPVPRPPVGAGGTRVAGLPRPDGFEPVPARASRRSAAHRAA